MNTILDRLCFASDGPQLQTADVARRIGVGKAYLSMVWSGKSKLSERCERQMCGILYEELIKGKAMPATKKRNRTEERLQGSEAIHTRDHMLCKMLEAERAGWTYWRTDLDRDSPGDLLAKKLIQHAGEIREKTEGRWVVLRCYRLTDKGRRRAEEIDSQCVEVCR